MDPRRYGFARIVAARRGGRGNGGGGGDDDGVVLGSGRRRDRNPTLANMNSEDVGMAMEVLRFAHVSMGGDPTDDLDDYYLGGSARDDDYDDDTEKDENDDDDADVVDDDGGGGGGASAGRHSDGHYTRFLDEDPDRGEAHGGGGSDDRHDGNVGDDRDRSGGATDAEWGSDDDEDDEDEDEDHDEDESVLVTTNDLRNAIRLAFRAPLVPPSSLSSNDAMPKSNVASRRHRDAIDACALIAEQMKMWHGKSSVSIDIERGVRIVTTSAPLSRPVPSSYPSGASSYRFAYRIRVENIRDIVDMGGEGEGGGGRRRDDHEGISTTADHGRAMQLLGRTWVISEQEPEHETTSSRLKRLLEEGVSEGGSCDKGRRGGQFRIVQTVNEPRTGAGKFCGIWV